MERVIKNGWFLWWIVFCFVACNRQTEQYMDMAEACMETCPDSAYSYLSLLAAMDEMSEGQLRDILCYGHRPCISVISHWRTIRSSVLQ